MDKLTRPSRAEGGNTPEPGSIASQVPDQLSLDELGVNFRLPAGVQLTGGWNPLTTGDGSTVYVRLTPRSLDVSFWPPLLVDAQWPMSNVAVEGFSYDFASGSIGRVSVSNTQTLAFGAKGFVDDAIREYVASLVAGTKLGRPGYDPLTDPDVMGTLQSLQGRASAGSAAPGEQSPLSLQDLGEITPMVTVSLRSDISQGTAEGSVFIPAGTSITLYAALAGSAQDLAQGGLQSVRYLSLSSPGIELRQDGAPVALLQDLRLSNGGGVEVSRFQPLGRVKEAADVESGLRALVALLQVGAATQAGYRGPIHTNLSPDIVNGVAEGELERALSGAIRGVIDQHSTAIPGVDLRSLLGIPAAAAAPGGSP